MWLKTSYSDDESYLRINRSSTSKISVLPAAIVVQFLFQRGACVTGTVPMVGTPPFPNQITADSWEYGVSNHEGWLAGLGPDTGKGMKMQTRTKPAMTSLLPESLPQPKGGRLTQVAADDRTFWLQIFGVLLVPIQLRSLCRSWRFSGATIWNFTEYTIDKIRFLQLNES